MTTRDGVFLLHVPCQLPPLDPRSAAPAYQIFVFASQDSQHIIPSPTYLRQTHAYKGACGVVSE